MRLLPPPYSPVSVNKHSRTLDMYSPVGMTTIRSLPWSVAFRAGSCALRVSFADATENPRTAHLAHAELVDPPDLRRLVLDLLGPRKVFPPKVGRARWPLDGRDGGGPPGDLLLAARLKRRAVRLKD